MFIVSTRIMKICHCGHYFKEEALREHFNNSTKCPLCRYDIRGSSNNLSENNSINGDNTNQPENNETHDNERHDNETQDNNNTEDNERQEY